MQDQRPRSERARDCRKLLRARLEQQRRETRIGPAVIFAMQGVTLLLVL